MKLLKVVPSVHNADNVTLVFADKQIVAKASIGADAYIGKDIDIKDGKIVEISKASFKK